MHGSDKTGFMHFNETLYRYKMLDYYLSFVSSFRRMIFKYIQLSPTTTNVQSYFTYLIYKLLAYLSLFYCTYLLPLILHLNVTQLSYIAKKHVNNIILHFLSNITYKFFQLLSVSKRSTIYFGMLACVLYYRMEIISSLLALVRYLSYPNRCGFSIINNKNHLAISIFTLDDTLAFFQKQRTIVIENDIVRLLIHGCTIAHPAARHSFHWTDWTYRPSLRTHHNYCNLLWLCFAMLYRGMRIYTRVYKCVATVLAQLRRCDTRYMYDNIYRSPNHYKISKIITKFENRDKKWIQLKIIKI